MRDREGKKHMLRCLGFCSQLLPMPQESSEFLALDVTTTRSLFLQNLLVLKATTHTSVPHLKRNSNPVIKLWAASPGG